ncbi:MAG: hypothetical protein LBQ80_02355 [Clostridium sp.]|jgi:hypothetical protein|nr:hypothetical protein [Clostridium sp.]
MLATTTQEKSSQITTASTPTETKAPQIQGKLSPIEGVNIGDSFSQAFSVIREKYGITSDERSEWNNYEIPTYKYYTEDTTFDFSVDNNSLVRIATSEKDASLDGIKMGDLKNTVVDMVATEFVIDEENRAINYEKSGLFITFMFDQNWTVDMIAISTFEVQALA